MMKQNIRLPQAEMVYLEEFIPASESSYFFDKLLTELRWREMEIKIFGKLRKQPRLSAWYGDPGTSYTYSGVTSDPLPWTETLLEIRRRVQLEAGVKFNSVLANRYRSGQDSMGSHSDDEPELGKNPVIASVSFGAARTFRSKHKTDASIPTHDLELKDGSFLLMKGPTQHHWKHEVPKTSKPVGERINLTFRTLQISRP